MTAKPSEREVELEAVRSKRREMAVCAWERLRGRRARSSAARDQPLSRFSDTDVVAVNQVLADLQSLDQRAAALVELRFFGNLGLAEAAHILGCSRAEVEAEWKMARAWLRRELREQLPDHKGISNEPKRKLDRAGGDRDDVASS